MPLILSLPTFPRIGRILWQILMGVGPLTSMPRIVYMWLARGLFLGVVGILIFRDVIEVRREIGTRGVQIAAQQYARTSLLILRILLAATSVIFAALWVFLIWWQEKMMAFGVYHSPTSRELTYAAITAGMAALSFVRSAVSPGVSASCLHRAFVSGVAMEGRAISRNSEMIPT